MDQRVKAAPPQWSRRDFILRSMGALGVVGLGGLSVVSCSSDDETGGGTTNGGGGDNGSATMTVRTMGLGTTVLDSVLEEFTK
jgi:hypothetical protein